MSIERTTFNGIVVGPYTYPVSRRRDGELYVRTFASPRPALEFLLGALSSGDVDVLFDGERIPFKRHDEGVLRDPWKIVVATLANDHERHLLSLFGINPFIE
jgi:hypothetical protein